MSTKHGRNYANGTPCNQRTRHNLAETALNVQATDAGVAIVRTGSGHLSFRCTTLSSIVLLDLFSRLPRSSEDLFLILFLWMNGALFDFQDSGDSAHR